MKRQKFLLGVFLILTGCMGSARPDWVQKNTTSFLHKETFYGIGKASGIHNKLMAKMTADDLARSEVAHLLDDYSVALIKAYRDSLSQDDLTKIESSQNLAFTFRTHVAMAIFEAEVDRSWTDKEQETVYTLVKLKRKRFTSRIYEASEDDPKLRRFLKENAKGIFENLREQQEKKQAADNGASKS